MKIFLDTANVGDIKTATDWGAIDGVTTNPSLVAKEGRDFKQMVLEICEIVNGPVSAEVISLEADKMVEEGKGLAAWHKNVIVKIPCTPDGLKATKILEGQGIKVNVTLVFSVNQVLLCAKAGASFISPFVGRLDDIGEDGMQMVAESVAVIKNYNFKSEIIVASVRSVEHAKKAALVGAHIATIPFKILSEMFKHPLTDKGIEKFLADWKGAEGKV
ncbi:MAG: fructose-6-phosphate aldolase [Candidatus Magasanikbacteria bacterium RIFOXYD2_FULL_41_14]|uniref:Probable transaldolase n=1 Tax=Candidatus Magasanikbacteria bacterium RIFOXYD2_FULL_41_14 TaxID=1798709 RepID=A0A1F6PC40_9BACT|nr:MAG: fructose-6-phosphate aldolase [Candidatus Magasanikbacteria bacterium RIFOXYD2_FULL_41_14]